MIRRRGLLRAFGQGTSVVGASLLLGILVDGKATPTTAEQADLGTTARRIDLFPIGVFEDGNVIDGNAGRFEAVVNNIRAHGLDSVLFSNNALGRDSALLDVSDRLGVNVILAPAWNLDRSWWPSSVVGTSANAQRVIGPLVDQVKGHASLKGYCVADEPDPSMAGKVALAIRAFRSLDPERLVMATLVGIDRVETIFDAARPDVLLIDVYPVGAGNRIGDFRMTGFGYPDLDFVGYVRFVTQTKPRGVPLWMILQTHKYDGGQRFSLREPTVAEVRAQNWLAIGEGATGIFWFTYSSEQGWTGLADNTTLFAEVADLAKRAASVREALVGCYRGAERFTARGRGSPYVSTLMSQDGNRSYAVVVNRNCTQDETIIIDAPGLHGQFRDLETSRVYPLGTSLILRPGDGRVFELTAPDSALVKAAVSPTATPVPAPDPTPTLHCES